MASVDELKQTETSALGEIEASYNNFRSRLEAFVQEYGALMNNAVSLAQNMAFGMANPAQVAALNQDNLQKLKQECDVLGQWQSYFLGFESTARSLGEAGLLRTAVRLREIEAEIIENLQIFQNVCSSTEQQMRAFAGIWNNAMAYTANAIRDVANRQSQVFETFRTRWNNEAFNKCPVCGSLLESRTLPYCPNPNCRTLVIRF
jgi:exoribonuclease II